MFLFFSLQVLGISLGIYLIWNKTGNKDSEILFSEASKKDLQCDDMLWCDDTK